LEVEMPVSSGLLSGAVPHPDRSFPKTVALARLRISRLEIAIKFNFL
jgi:hypothetical protein